MTATRMTVGEYVATMTASELRRLVERIRKLHEEGMGYDEIDLELDLPEGKDRHGFAYRLMTGRYGRM